MINEPRFMYLLDRVQSNLASEAECTELMQLIHNDESGECIAKANEFFAEHTSGVVFNTPDEWWNGAVKQILDTDKKDMPVQKIKRFAWRYWAAASILLIAFTGIIYISQKNKTTTTKEKDTIVQVLPGKEGAILTLADGSQVLLDTINNGTVALQGGVEARVVNGSLIYQGKGNEIVYNTMTTPKGRNFHLTLPDKTEVWMNAASSIRFPTSFTGNERRVEVTGEVYFEVAKQAHLPFRVEMNKRMEVEVLGTNFNVYAYNNEAAINTTLLKGAVKVSAMSEQEKRNAVLLKPGQQARLNGSGNNAGEEKIELISNIDPEIVMAWRNGIFNFDKAGLPEVMRQLERWYDIEVKFDNFTSAERFTGRMYRDLPLADLLTQFEKTGAKFTIKGRTVTVSN